MFSKKAPSPHRTLAFRLTLWYAGIFALSCLLAFTFFYLLATTAMRGQVDQDLRKQASVFASLMRTSGLEAVERIAVIEAQAAGEKKIFFRLMYPTGVAFSSSNMSYWENIGISRQAIRQLLEGGQAVLATIAIPGRRHAVRVLYERIAPGIVLQLGQSMENYSRFLGTFRRLFAVTVSVLIVVGALIGWFMAQRAVSGVRAVTRTADRIARGALDERVPVTGRGDEIDQLAVTFNRMLDRIQTLVGSIQEMSDNIAHDLRSPLTILRGNAEIALTTGRRMGEFREMAAATIEACDRLLDTINTMLVISRTEAGVEPLAVAPLDLGKIVRDACELFQPMAEDRGVALRCTADGALRVEGDLSKLQRTISNLIDNALKYTPAGRTVDVRLVPAADGGARVTVHDTGSGIAAADLPHIFERFYRCDRSRSAGCPQNGAGLGLSLARAVARAHGGDIQATSTEGAGSTFTLHLPAAPPAAGGNITKW